MTKAQATKLAKQIFDEFDSQIVEATKGTNIPPRFIAGLIANEAGKDRQGNIKRGATRFEPHIYTRLKKVAETPGAVYNRIKHLQLKDATDASLRALAHSYEATQMMGYWCIVLGCSLADLKNPEKHFFFTVKLLQLNDQDDFERGTEEAFDDEMRQWNTGREKGKTYHENYVPNARLIRAAYAELEKTRGKLSVNELANTSAVASVSSEQQAGDNPTVDPHQSASSTAEPTTQIAENIINTAPKPAPSQNVVIEKRKEEGWLASKWKQIVGLFTAGGVLDGITDRAQALQAFGLSSDFWKRLLYVAAAGAVVWLITDWWKHRSKIAEEKKRDEILARENSSPGNFVQFADTEYLQEYRNKGYKVITR